MDLLVLHALSSKSKYHSLKHAVPVSMLSPDTDVMLQWFNAYYNAFPDRDVIVLDELKELIKLRSSTADKDSVAMTLHLLDLLRDPPDEVAVSGILGQLYELDLSGRAAALIAEYQNGGEVDLAYELSRLSSKAVRSKAQAAPYDYLETSVDQLLLEITDDRGLKFNRLQVLNEHILGLQGGASVAIAARPDKGKTSFIAHCLTGFAPQVVAMYDNTRPILWLNNEGSGKRIIPRLYQAALGKDLNEIIAMSNKGELEEAYTNAVGGVQNIIRVKDMHSATIAQIEQVLEAQRPSVVVADMLANFRISKHAAVANKTDSVEQLWQEWRELMVRYDCVGLATIQISVEGEDLLYPPYSALKDSKTGVQGAADIILTLGSRNNPELQYMRGLSSPKNKYAVPGKPSCFQAEVYFDASKCMFNDGYN